MPTGHNNIIIIVCIFITGVALGFVFGISFINHLLEGGYIPVYRLTKYIQMTEWRDECDRKKPGARHLNV